MSVKKFVNANVTFLTFHWNEGLDECKLSDVLQIQHQQHDNHYQAAQDCRPTLFLTDHSLISTWRQKILLKQFKNALFHTKCDTY